MYCSSHFTQTSGHSSHSLCFQKIKESRWTEVGLLASSVILFLIGSLASSGIPLGTVNVASLTYALFGVGSFFLIAGIVKIALHCCSKKRQPQHSSDLSNILLNNNLDSKLSVKKDPNNLNAQNGSHRLIVIPRPYSPLGSSAIEFARNKLQEHAHHLQDLKHQGQGKIQLQPINQEIGDLYTLHLYYDQILLKWINFFQNEPDFWNNPSVIQLVNQSMYINYAISCLTLEDLPAFTKQRAAQGDRKSFAQTLMNPENYFFEVFSLVNTQFEALRLGIFWKDLSSQEATEDVLLKFEHNLAYKLSFYQEAKPQNLWRLLSNDFCERLRTYVSHEELVAECSSSIKTDIYKYYDGQRILFSKD